ncbi:MAG TPA: hypothetical protein VNM43_11540 [Dehalococcoidia bacterium]|nr:hypothetical protein [Dehalococcoidia bacterium]
MRRIPSVFFGALALSLAGALAAGCGGGTDTIDRFIDRYSQVALARDEDPLTILDLRSGERRELLPGGECGKFVNLSWSPDGGRLLCVGATGEQETTATVLDAATGEVINVIRRAAPVSWWWCGERLVATVYSSADRNALVEIRDDRGHLQETVGPVAVEPALVGRSSDGEPLCGPSGDRIAYRDAASGAVTVLQLDDLTREVVARDAWPLVWVEDGAGLVIAREYRRPEPHQYAEYEAWLLDVASGHETRLPFLDDQAQFWVAPDGVTVVFIPKQRRPDGLPSLAVGSLDSGETRPIPDSLITYGSDFIPASFVRFSDDARTLYWISDATAVFRYDLAREDGRAERLSEWERPVAFTPDPRVVAHQTVQDTQISLELARADGADRRVLTRGETSPDVTSFFSMAWRPPAE